jgi:hypothetical protein
MSRTESAGDPSGERCPMPGATCRTAPGIRVSRIESTQRRRPLIRCPSLFAHRTHFNGSLEYLAKPPCPVVRRHCALGAGVQHGWLSRTQRTERIRIPERARQDDAGVRAHGLAASTMLNGVRATQATRPNPAVFRTERRRASPACAPSATRPCLSAHGVHISVEPA